MGMDCNLKKKWPIFSSSSCVSNRAITIKLMTVCYSSEKSVNIYFSPGCSKSNFMLRGKVLCENTCIFEQFD